MNVRRFIMRAILPLTRCGLLDSGAPEAHLKDRQPAQALLVEKMRKEAPSAGWSGPLMRIVIQRRVVGAF
jgi:hypothetical protein